MNEFLTEIFICNLSLYQVVRKILSFNDCLKLHCPSTSCIGELALPLGQRQLFTLEKDAFNKTAEAGSPPAKENRA
jgi:hypothetical protein